ncbi:hypothetical protein VE03_04431 [Pseudogymnoascus sp. 23342-1-I1]|nr:hypothetical protein VE03_04431 [Pseudogymnoascus sp. 23342-1-I1]
MDSAANLGQPYDDDTRVTRPAEIPNSGGKTDTVPADEVPTKPPFIYEPQPLLPSERPLPPPPDSTLINDLNGHLHNAKRALDKERKHHQETKVFLLQKQREAEQLRQSWRDVAGELSRHLRQVQGVNPLTDDELKQRIIPLRSEIRKFAVTHFQNNIRDLKISKQQFQFFNERLALGRLEFDAFMEQTSARIDLMQASLWWFLDDRVFKRYQWATREASEHMQGMCEVISPLLSDHTEGVLSDSRRKFHMWRAHTSNLIINVMSLDKKNAKVSETQFVEETIQDVTQTLSHFSTSDLRELETGLAGIIYKCLDLDEELSRQVAAVTFSCSTGFLPQPFDSETMVCTSDYRVKDEDSKDVSLVIVPGLFRRGQSSGEEFDKRIRLMKTDVACGVPRPDRSDGSDRCHSTVEGSTTEGSAIEGRIDRLVKVEKGITEGGRWSLFHKSSKRSH